MYGELGFVSLKMTEECESVIALQLDVNRARYKNSQDITMISAAMFDLGAMTSTPESDGKGNTIYTVIFTRFFERSWSLYWEFLDLLHAHGVQIDAYWEGNGRTYWVNNAGISEAEELIVNNEDHPSNLDAMREKVQDMRYWTEITDSYIHIPPPTRVVLKNT